jgi:hypothetical protein
VLIVAGGVYPKAVDQALRLAADDLLDRAGYVQHVMGGQR